MGTEQRSQRQKHVFDALDPPIEATGTQASSEDVVRDKMHLRTHIIAAKKERCYDGDGHNFGVGQVTVRIVTMMQGLQHISTQTIHWYNVAIHEEGLQEERLST